MPQTPELSFYEESRVLSRSRGKLACIFGIILVPIFLGLDYFLAPEHFRTFFTLRMVNTAVNILIYLVLQYVLRLSLRQLNIITTFYFCSIGIMIAYMCHVMGGYGSTYYAGLNLVMLAVGVVMAWHWIYTMANGLIIFGAYVLLGHTPNFLWVDFTNSSYFLLSTLLVCVIGTAWKEKQRLKEFDLRRELQELDRAKSNFLATISHELKTPMTLIVNPLERALAQAQGGSAVLDRQMIELVRRNTYRLSTLVSDLIEIARGEVGKRELVPTEITDVSRYFTELFETIRPLFDEKGIRAASDIPAGLESHDFDQKKIDKVVYNLLTNAAKFTSRGGEVRLGLQDLPGPAGGGRPVLEISVTDTGIGIAPDKLDAVFERFRQLDEGSTRSYEGMGIGLSLVKDFSEQHGGSVSVTSQPGAGSTFVVRLPRGREHFTVPVVSSEEGLIPTDTKLIRTQAVMKQRRPLRVAPPAVAPEASGARATLLVVDDNSDLIESIRRILSPTYRVLTAENGQEGLAEARRSGPDLILTDIMMPVMDGYQMTREIRKEANLKDLPVIMLTAKSGREGLEEGFASGATDYLTKPFSPGELLSRVENMLNLKRQREEIAHRRDELAHINQVLRETQDQLVQAEKLSAIGILAAGMAHELNNPMGAIRNYIQLLLEDRKEGDPEWEVLKAAETATGRCKRIVADLLSFSRETRDLKDLDLNQILQQSIETARRDLGRPELVLESHLAANLPHIEADILQIQQVIGNLIHNAADAITGAGRVLVETVPDDGHLLVRVSDTGCGISAENLPKIFDPFFTTKSPGKGMGLGLALCYNIISRCEGSIDVASEPGKGSTFTIRLPAVAHKNQKGGKDHARETSESHSRRTKNANLAGRG